MAIDRAANGFFIPFVLDESTVLADQPFIYRPWGTRTIKLRVTARTDMPQLWICPQGVLPEEADLGICRAYADDSRTFIITWGVGMRKGLA